MTHRQASVPVVHYWSFEASTGDTWMPLAEVWAAIGGIESRGSEPDLVITTDDAHAWVEAKRKSSSGTTPSAGKGARQRYTRRIGWYVSVVRAPSRTV